MKILEKRFIIRETQNKKPVDSYDDIAIALVTWGEITIENKKNKNYKPNFYELFDKKTGIIYDEDLNEKKKKRRIFNRGIDNYIEEFNTKQEAINFLKKYNLDAADYYIEKFF